MKSLVVGTVVLAAAYAVALSGASQTATSSDDKKPNIAVSIGQHVGERVQVVGASDWVTSKSAPAPSEPGGPPPELPHIDVLTVKVLAPKC